MPSLIVCSGGVTPGEDSQKQAAADAFTDSLQRGEATQVPPQARDEAEHGVLEEGYAPMSPRVEVAGAVYGEHVHATRKSAFPGIRSLELFGRETVGRLPQIALIGFEDLDQFVIDLFVPGRRIACLASFEGPDRLDDHVGLLGDRRDALSSPGLRPTTSPLPAVGRRPARSQNLPLELEDLMEQELSLIHI